MEIVQFQPADEAAVRRLHREVYRPLQLAAFRWQPCQQIESLAEAGVKCVCRDESVVGYAAAYRLDETHFRLNLLVDPQRTRQGIGTRLLERVEAELGGQYLQARLLESMPSSLAFALARGFQEVHRMRGLSLAARDFPGLARWAALGERLAAQGFVVTTWQAELEAGGDPVGKLAALTLRAQEGWPLPDPTWRSELTLERARALFSNVAEPARFSILKLGAGYVGYTSAWNEMATTAVHPDYRGLGIATWLKACDIASCIADGQTQFESATANPAMQRVNEKLGYRLNGLAEIRLVKKL